MNTETLKQKIQKATTLLEEFAATTAALAPYPVSTISTVTVTKDKKKKKVDEES